MSALLRDDRSVLLALVREARPALLALLRDDRPELPAFTTVRRYSRLLRDDRPALLASFATIVRRCSRRRPSGGTRAYSAPTVRRY